MKSNKPKTSETSKVLADELRRLIAISNNESSMLEEWYQSIDTPTEDYIQYIRELAQHYFKYYKLKDDRLEEIVLLTVEKRDKFNPERGDIETYFGIVVKSYIISKILWSTTTKRFKV